jgi:hypothetical protein
VVTTPRLVAAAPAAIRPVFWFPAEGVSVIVDPTLRDVFAAIGAF